MRFVRPSEVAVVILVSMLSAACIVKRPFRTPALEERPPTFRFSQVTQMLEAKSGLRFALQPDNRTNLVNVDVRYQVGAADDPMGKAGLAHLTEHMLFSPRIGGANAPSLYQRLDQAALSYNAVTALDHTYYTAAALKGGLAALLAIEADRMKVSCSDFDPQEFAREREVVRNELRLRASEQQRNYATILEALFGPAHPYGRASSDEQIAAITLQDVCDFVNDYYVQSRAVVVISGNFESQQAAALIDRTFRGIPRRKPAARATILRPRFDGKVTKHETASNKAWALLLFPGRPHAPTKKSAALRVLSSSLRHNIDDLEGEKGIIDTGVLSARSVRHPFVGAWIEVDKPDKLEGAVEHFFSQRDRLVSFWADNTRRKWFALHFEDAVEVERYDLLWTVESFSDRSRVFANRLQYEGHSDSILRELRALTEITFQDLTQLAPRQFQRSESRILLFYPSDQARHAPRRAVMSFTPENADRGLWQAEIDPDEAQRQLPVHERAINTTIIEHTLQNGLRVVLAPAIGSPLLDVRMIFPVGYLHDPPNARGVARAAAAALETDRKREYSLDEATHLTLMTRKAGRMAHQVDEQSTTFLAAGLATRADAVIAHLNFLLETGIMNWDPDAVAKQLSKRTLEDKRALAWDLRKRQLLFGKEHPYARPRLSAARARTLSKKTLEEFRNRNYVVSGATLVIVGDFEPDRVMGYVRKSFGQWPAAPAAKRVIVDRAKPALRRPTFLAREPQGVDTDLIDTSIYFAVPKGTTRDRAARLVVAEMLKLELSKLREELAATYDVGVSLTDLEGPGTLEISCAFDGKRSIETMKFLSSALAGFRQGHDRLALFVRARRVVLQRLLADVVSVAAVAGELHHLAAHNLDRDHPAKLAHAVARLTPHDVDQFVTTWLRENNTLYTLSGHRPTLDAIFRSLGVTAEYPASRITIKPKPGGGRK